MSTIVNMVVLSKQTFSLFITSPLLNNIVETRMNDIVETRMNDIVGPKMLLTHDNNVVQALFRQQPCNSL